MAYAQPTVPCYFRIKKKLLPLQAFNASIPMLTNHKVDRQPPQMCNWKIDVSE